MSSAFRPGLSWLFSSQHLRSMKVLSSLQLQKETFVCKLRKQHLVPKLNAPMIILRTHPTELQKHPQFWFKYHIFDSERESLPKHSRKKTERQEEIINQLNNEWCINSGEVKGLFINKHHLKLRRKSRWQHKQEKLRELLHPKPGRLHVDRAWPPALGTCRLTPVFCTPVRSWVSLRAVNICPSPRAGQLLGLQLTDKPGGQDRVEGRGGSRCALWERGLGRGPERQSRRRPLRTLGHIHSPPLQQATREAAAWPRCLTSWWKGGLCNQGKPWFS